MNKFNSLKQLAHGAGITFIFAIIGYIGMFFFKVIIARIYGPNDFGLYTLALTLFGLAALIAGLGINSGIPRYIPLYKHLSKKGLLSGYISHIFRFPFFMSLFLSALLIFFSDNIVSFYNLSSDFSFFLLIIAIALPLRALSNTLRSIFIAEKRFFFRGLSYEIFEKLIFLIGAFFLWFYNLNILYLILLFLLSILLPLITEFFYYKYHIHLIKTSKKIFITKEWLCFSLPLLFTGIFGFFISWTDNLVIGRYLDASSLGIYSIAYSFAMFLGFFQSSFTSIFMPLISEHYGKNRHDLISFLFKKSAAWVFGLTFPLFLIMILYSREVLKLFYGFEFGAGYLPLIIVAVGFLINISTGLNTQILILHKQTKLIFVVNIFIAFFNLLLNIFLIPIIGLIGAAIASSISMASQNIVFLYYASKLESLNFDWTYNLKFIISGVPSVIVGASFFRLGLSNLIAIPLSLFVYISLYSFFLLLLKTFRQEDLKIILAFEKKFGLNLSLAKKIFKKFY